jgi:hypothetical protein
VLRCSRDLDADKGVGVKGPPISSGVPICTGAPCIEGKRVVTCTALMASAGFSYFHGDQPIVEFAPQGTAQFCLYAGGSVSV